MIEERDSQKPDEENDQVTPEESIAVIAEIINAAKIRMEEGGITLIIWGLYMVFAPLGQIYLVENGHSNYQGIPYMVAPIIFLIHAILERKRKGSIFESGYFSNVLTTTWYITAVNIFIVAFFLPDDIVSGFRHALVMCFLSIAYTITGVTLKTRVIWLGGIFINFMGIISLFVHDWAIICFSIAGFFGMVVPGILLYLKEISRKKSNA